MDENVKISELPVASTIASPDVAPIVQGGVTKQADVSLFGGSFFSNETARVDPVYGDDSTGVIGNLDKPFATTQGAIDALELINPLPSNPIILIGGNNVDGFNTVLGYVTIIGENGLETIGSSPLASAISTVMNMNSDVGGDQNIVTLIIRGCWIKVGVNFNSTLVPGELNLIDSASPRAAIFASTSGANAAIPLTINGNNTYNGAFSQVKNVHILGGSDPTSIELNNVLVNNNISSDNGNTDLILNRSIVTNILSSIGNIQSTDSRIIGTNSASGTLTISDVLFDPSKFDFSTLPTSLPTEVGKAWIDTTGGFNIVKVKL